MRNRISHLLRCLMGRSYLRPIYELLRQHRTILVLRSCGAALDIIQFVKTAVIWSFLDNETAICKTACIDTAIHKREAVFSVLRHDIGKMMLLGFF